MKKIKLESIKIKVRRKYINLTKKIRRTKISNNDFTIISNNCWAGFIYQSYGMKYNTPTIGMFFMADDYIKFISNLKYYLSIEKMKFIKPEESKWYNELKSKDNYGTYPIGVLDDIELHLLHYNSEKDAQEKWNKRKARVNYQNILYKFSEMNLCSEKEIRAFQTLNFKNKICFVTKKYSSFCNDYTYKVTNNRKLLASQEPFGNSRVVNINMVINKLRKK